MLHFAHVERAQRFGIGVSPYREDHPERIMGRGNPARWTDKLTASHVLLLRQIFPQLRFYSVWKGDLDISSIMESGAFVETLNIEPIASGPLDSCTFAVKDIIDVADHITGCGNPTWHDTHEPAATNAVCVDQMLHGGARCLGKTITDQLAFSLDGENHYYGTPRNPRAPDRVPGGSSSGSASAVAHGHVDFALGTDTGGSIRIPANNCGIYGLRPSHGRVSVAGVMPFSPTYDTVGILAATSEILEKSARVLLACDHAKRWHIGTIHLIVDAFESADSDVLRALDGPLTSMRRMYGQRLRETQLDIFGDDITGRGLEAWYQAFHVLQWAEIWSTLGTWVESTNPPLGPRTQHNFALVRNLDRSSVQRAIENRERLYRALHNVLGPTDVLCMPTAPALAPLKGSLPIGRTTGGYYPRTVSFISIAGVARLPQITMPVASADGVPVGLSVLARHGEDAFLLDVMNELVSASIGRDG
ncbi:MAG: amidase [Chloroflexota bacterium]